MMTTILRLRAHSRELFGLDDKVGRGTLNPKPLFEVCFHVSPHPGCYSSKLRLSNAMPACVRVCESKEFRSLGSGKTSDHPEAKPWILDSPSFMATFPKGRRRIAEASEIRVAGTGSSVACAGPGLEDHRLGAQFPCG